MKTIKMLIGFVAIYVIVWGVLRATVVKVQPTKCDIAAAQMRPKHPARAPYDMTDSHQNQPAAPLPGME